MGTYKSTKDYAATIRASLKAELPEYKFSVTCDGNSIYVAFISGPIELVYGGHRRQDINPYHFSELPYTYKGQKVVQKAHEILMREHWNESRPEIDYFSVAFYPHLSIGKWNRDYVVIPAKKGKK